MFAVIQTGGKQYKVELKKRYKIEKLPISNGGNINFDKVLLVADGKDFSIGAPYIPGAKVSATVLKQDRHDKVVVFRYHNKTRYRKKKGHRQPFSEIEVTKISL